MVAASRTQPAVDPRCATSRRRRRRSSGRVGSRQSKTNNAATTVRRSGRNTNFLQDLLCRMTNIPWQNPLARRQLRPAPNPAGRRRGSRWLTSQHITYALELLSSATPAAGPARAAWIVVSTNTQVSSRSTGHRRPNYVLAPPRLQGTDRSTRRRGRLVVPVGREAQPGPRRRGRCDRRRAARPGEPMHASIGTGDRCRSRPAKHSLEDSRSRDFKEEPRLYFRETFDPRARINSKNGNK